MAGYNFSLQIIAIFVFSGFCLAVRFSIDPSSPQVNPGQLVHQVCKNTTNYSFCEEAVYADPQAPTADRYVLAYIAFGKAYENATNTTGYIDLLMKNAKRNSTLLDGLQKCRSYYQEAVGELMEAMNDLDSETFDGLEELAVSADNASQNCEESFKGHSPLSRKNQNLSALCRICVVVSKLYEVS